MPDLTGLKNIPVQQNRPLPPIQFDSTKRMKVKIKLPKLQRGNLEINAQVRIVWSQKMEDKAEEERKREAARQAKEKEHRRLTNLLSDCGSLDFTDFFDPSGLLQTSKERMS